MQAVMSEFERSLREGKGPDELTGRVWSLDNRQLLNTKRWLRQDEEQGTESKEYSSRA
jgi:3'-5' exoribonuclease